MRILFVCSGNSHRSPLAEALMKKSRHDLEADSAGTQIAIPISEEVRKYLTTENAEQYLKKFPENLDSKKLIEYDLIVAMEQRHKNAILHKCPTCENRVTVWNIKDPYFLPNEYATQIYDQIKEKVRKLAETL